jgi:putative intracellular protease/amidase
MIPPDVSPSGSWDVFALADRRIVTGANPEGAKVTAEEALKGI